ncbi:MAG TPA: helix-turn-helix domain-containing protein [Rhodocyclaceae bacterium]|nr:helix-turn-helix domain-containing protein [Rhodocyclaceae bacterium]
MPIPNAILQSSPRYRCVKTYDADEQAGVVSYGEWSQHYEQLSNGPYRGQVEDLELGPLTILRETGNCIVLQTGMMMRNYFAFGIPMNAQGEAYFCGNIIKGNCMTVLHPDAEFELRTTEKFGIVAAAFKPDVFCRFLGDPSVTANDLERDLRALPRAFDTPVTADFARFLNGLMDAAQNHPTGLLTHSLQTQIADELMELISACISTGERNNSYAVRAGRDRLVQRVRKYLDRPWEEPVNIANVCEDLSVTRRTLQNAMQEVLGVSPQAYLKAIRLNGVRRALKNRNRINESIADVASEWGFWHLSQFAQDYFRLFGERPSDTRKRLHAH